MIISNENMVVAWVNTTQEPTKVEHICYYSMDKGETVVLYRMVREYYPHPTHPEDAQISLINTRLIEEIPKANIKAGKIMTLLYAENGLQDYYHLLEK
jgi:hypothetical protein